jgi:hypothetical protein
MQTNATVNSRFNRGSKFYQLIFAVFFTTQVSAADEKITAKTFAGPDGKLNEQQAAFYIVYRDKEPLSKVLSPGETKLDPKKVVASMADKLDDLRTTTGHTSPWTWQELDAAAAKTKAAEGPPWKKIEGITKAGQIGKNGAQGSFGPFRLRQSAADFPKDLKDAKGATIGYSDNRLVSGNGAWNSQGALDYPIKLIQQGNLAGQSLEFDIGPATEWKLAEAQGTSGKNVQELTFSFPLTAYLSPGRSKMTGSYEENMATADNQIFSALWIFQTKPYFQTDFSIQHEIYGVTASAEFVGGAFGLPLYLGAFQDLGATGLQYQLRAIPQLDYSETARGGLYTTRKAGDDWLRVGGTVSLDIRLGGTSSNPLDLGISYQFLGTVSGSGDFSDLLKTHATLWLTENTGLTLEYSKGDTPVADKTIDLLALSLEVKY